MSRESDYQPDLPHSRTRAMRELLAKAEQSEPDLRRAARVQAAHTAKEAEA